MPQKVWEEAQHTRRLEGKAATEGWDEVQKLAERVSRLEVGGMNVQQDDCSVDKRVLVMGGHARETRRQALVAEQKRLWSMHNSPEPQEAWTPFRRGASHKVR